MPHDHSSDYSEQDLRLASLSCAAEVFAAVASDDDTPQDVLDFVKVVYDWVNEAVKKADVTPLRIA